MALGGVVQGDGADLGPIGGGGGEDLLLIRLPIGVNHRSVGAKTGMAIFLDMAQFLAETANNSFGFSVVPVSIEATKIRFEWRLPLSEANRVDSLQLLFSEVVLLFLSNGRVTGVGGSSGCDSATSLVMMNDFNLLSIPHALS